MKEGAGLTSQSHPDEPKPSGAAGSARAGQTNPTLRRVRVALRKQNWAEAERFAVRALDDGLMPIRIAQIFTKAGKPELLVRAVWSRRDSLFKQLRDVAWFAKLAAAAELGDEYIAKLRRWAVADAVQPVTFGLHDYLRAYESLGDRVLAALFCLKDRAWILDTSGDILEKAAQLADRFEVAPETAQFFYSHRADRDMSLAAWLPQFKTTQVLSHLYSDGVDARRFRHDPDGDYRKTATSFCRMARMTEYLDDEGAKRLFESLDRSRGLLLCTFHGGFLRMSSYFFVKFMPNPFWVTAKGEEQSNIVVVKGNEHGAAFRTFKALVQGKAVLMAPDGPHYGETSSVEVEIFGLKAKISEGAAVLAYESKCDTGWISAVRRGNMFVPDYLPGPRRLQGETYKVFRDRWVSFYVRCIERAFSSPENLVPISRWATPGGRWWN